MTDSSDLEVGLELAYAAEDRLMAKDPSNELISYRHIKDDRQRDEAWQKLLRRFSRDPDAKGNVRGEHEGAYAVAKYLIALETALGERKPKPEKSLEERMKDPHDSMWDLD